MSSSVAEFRVTFPTGHLAQLRHNLGCSDDPYSECRGLTVECELLLESLADVQGLEDGDGNPFDINRCGPTLIRALIPDGSYPAARVYRLLQVVITTTTDATDRFALIFISAGSAASFLNQRRATMCWMT